jgi:hypothetical protein
MTPRISPIGAVDSTVTTALMVLNNHWGMITVTGGINKKPPAVAEGFLTRTKSKLAEKNL